MCDEFYMSRFPAGDARGCGLGACLRGGVGRTVQGGAGAQLSASGLLKLHDEQRAALQMSYFG